MADAESEKEKAATYLSQVGQDSGSAMAADLEENKRSREETPEEDQKTQPSILPTSGKVKGATLDVAGGAGAASADHERRSEPRSNGAAAGKGNRGGDHTPQSSSGQQQLQFPNHKILPQHVTITAQQLLPTSVLRNLYDKLYEKRKAAALEVEQIVKSLAGAGDLNRVHALLSLLVRDYALSPLSNHRKGGLIGLAAATVGLVGNFVVFLPLIVPPVLRSFDDTDSRVRYYACEALYNMAKVARDDFVPFFNDVFDALCKLSADVDPNVQNAAHLLDKLIKDIVSESPHFDLIEFITLLRQRLQVRNPYVRQFLVSWIAVLDSVPDIDMLEHLPEFMEGLLSMLSDPNRDIRQQADAALGEFLGEIKHIQRTADTEGEIVVPFDVEKVVWVLVERAQHSDEFTQLTALAWLHDFVGLFGNQLVAHFDHFLDAVLPCLSHPNQRMSQVAEGTNRTLLSLDTKAETFDVVATIRVIKRHLEVCTRRAPSEAEASTTGRSHRSGTPHSDYSDHSQEGSPREQQGSLERTWLEALRWLSVLLDRNKNEVLSVLDDLLPLLFEATADGSEEVVLKALEVEASIAKGTSEFQRLVAALLDRFRGERGSELLRQRGSLVIRRLCALLGASKVFITVSTLLVREQDLPFASTMVQALNLILLTAPELKQPRDCLKGVYDLVRPSDGNSKSTSSEGHDQGQRDDPVELFESLYRSFSHSCCAVLSLCIHAGAYAHACEVLDCLGTKLEVTSNQLLELDRLVQLLESPMFVGTRMRLLDPAKHPALCKCLYGVLTLLPQAKAFQTLNGRLASIPSDVLARLNELMHPASAKKHRDRSLTRSKDTGGDRESGIHFDRLLHVFLTCQQKHVKLHSTQAWE